MSDPYFIAVSAITIASAIIALEFRELIYGAIALAVTLLGIAMFFVLLDATFVAMFQITVYVGAVVVLIIFTIMLVRREAWLRLDEGGRRRIMGVVVALAVIGLVGALLAGSSIARWQASESAPTLIQIGEEMLTYYSPAFIALALTLAASVIGALVLAKVERGEASDSEAGEGVMGSEEGEARGAVGEGGDTRWGKEREEER
ncbi:MAG: NADH-quinone oxidoreductase subunit J [Candidatus Nitrosocaldus sp.]|nr:NADH-quinone oxidoreductase subunit J [Candidatus Nitrosocaldus sp.]MDW7999960.1 NADH-quinone oxidoreductase subunit J [Candidatus Nitrosocaldus sp.]